MFLFAILLLWVNKAVEYFWLCSVVFKDPVKDIGDEDACLLCRKGNAHEEKDKSISECAELVPDELPEDGVQQGFMLVMKLLVYPLAEAGFADLGKAQAFLDGDTLKF